MPREKSRKKHAGGPSHIGPVYMTRRKQKIEPEPVGHGAEPCCNAIGIKSVIAALINQGAAKRGKMGVLLLLPRRAMTLDRGARLGLTIK